MEAWHLQSPRLVRGLQLETGWLRFYRDGSLRELMLYRPQNLLGVPCFGGGLAGTEIRFHPSGTLAQFVLAAPHVVAGVAYPRGTRIHITEPGRVSKHRAVKLGAADPG